MSTLLQVRDLYLEFKTSRGQLKALNGMSFEVQAGEVSVEQAAQLRDQIKQANARVELQPEN